MKKTSVYLEPELDRALARAAREEGVSRAELIRDAVRQRVAGVGRPRIQAIGVAEGPAPGDVSANVDGYLAEWGFGED